MTGVEDVGVFIRERVWLENSLSQYLSVYLSVCPGGTTQNSIFEDISKIRRGSSIFIKI